MAEPDETALAEGVAAELAAAGWSVAPGFLPGDEVRALADEAFDLWRDGAFRQAGVGRGPSFEIRPEVRSDRVLWLDPAAPTAAQGRYLGRMETLRLALNRALFLGLFGFEAHLTLYPPGAFYRRHLDQFKNARHRVVSAILYLNQGWSPEDGGALRLYLDPDDPAAVRDLPPEGGTLVCFLSDTFYHEVLPAARERLSLTGWFTVRP